MCCKDYGCRWEERGERSFGLLDRGVAGAAIVGSMFDAGAHMGCCYVDRSKPRAGESVSIAVGASQNARYDRQRDSGIGCSRP